MRRLLVWTCTHVHCCCSSLRRCARFSVLSVAMCAAEPSSRAEKRLLTRNHASAAHEQPAEYFNVGRQAEVAVTSGSEEFQSRT